MGPYRKSRILPAHTQKALLEVVRPKFNAYFAFTSAPGNTRSVATGVDPKGNTIFTYPDASMISDLMVFWSLFAEVYELLKSTPVKPEVFCTEDPSLQRDFYRIIEDGEFWESPTGVGSLRSVSLSDAVPGCLNEIWRTLRNGFAHFHWHYEDLSAEDYWRRQGWDTTGAPAAFALPTRGKHNYKGYIVDAGGTWSSANFWGMKNLRIIVTPYGILRYHLHRFLNVVLNGSSKDVFGN